jgi:hypothetical protein
MAVRYPRLPRRGGTVASKLSPRRRPTQRPRLELLETRTLLTGTWTKVVNPVPNGDQAGTMFLLSDGTVMAQGGGVSNNWYKLTPDSTGSYVNGTWSNLANSNDERLYYSSQILKDGRLFVAGGEYDGAQGNLNDINTGEIYNPAQDTWTPIADFPQAILGDAVSETLPDGRILVGQLNYSYIYNPATNTWTPGPSPLNNDSYNEEGWVKLADGSTLDYQIQGTNPQSGARLVLGATDAQDQWVPAGQVPVQLDSGAIGGELGPSFLLPNGKVFWVGASANTAIYTPPTPGNPQGSWVAGPTQTDSGGGPIGAFDAPGAVETNGKVIWSASPVDAKFPGPTTILEYDPTTNTISHISAPAGSDLSGPAFTDRMLELPSGQILFSDGSQSSLFVYNPDSAPNPAWAPTISTITSNGGNSYTLTGTQINGLNEGAAYGDDVQNSTNYPIVRLTDPSGNVIFAKTSNWSSEWVATGTTPETVNFTLPPGANANSYTLDVIANGISSASVIFHTAISVSFVQPSGISEGLPFTNKQIAIFSDPSPQPVGSYAATIDWGNGQTTAGTISSVGGNNYQIRGGSDYTEGGTYHVIVSVTKVGLPAVSGSGNIVVQDAPLTANAVNFTSVEGSPFSGIVATFTDADPSPTNPLDYLATIFWGDGTSSAGTIQSDAVAGYDVVSSKTYGEEGTYAFSVQIRDSGGATAVALGEATTTDAALSGTPVTFTPVEAGAFNGLVGHFTDGNLQAPLTDFSVNIDWGDGTTTGGTVATATGGGYNVNGSHTYAEEGQHSVSISITDLGGSSTSITSTAVVSDAPLVAALLPFSPVEGAAFSGAVASFTDTDPGGVLTDYSAMILWGDGNSDAGTIQLNGAGGFNVLGSHSYADAGGYSLSVVINDVGGATTTPSGPLTVADAPITVTGGVLAPVEGIAFSTTVATFTDADPSPRPPTNYAALINWGDGQSVVGTITPLGNGVYAVSGGHTYANEGTNVVTITVNDNSGSASFAQISTVVSDATLSSSGIAFPAVEGGTFTGIVGNFSDANVNAPAGDFKAVVFWGDGTNTQGIVTSLGGGNFSVTGSHTFGEEGSIPVTVAINDVGGSLTSANSIAEVADAPLSATPLTVNLTEGMPFSGPVATFTDANPHALASQFVAVITFGDGTTNPGVVVASSQGGFNVLAAKTYQNAGNYNVHVSILDNGGASASVTGQAIVADAALTASGMSLNLVEGTATPQVVAQFKDADPTVRPPAFYSATIAWGDGSTSAGTIQSNPAGGYFVLGTHAFEEGGYPYQITIQDTDGSQVLASGSVAVTDAPLTAGAPIALASGEGTPFSGIVATFSDGNPIAHLGDFTASITWGDGTTTAGTVSAIPGGQFGVSGSHVYGAGSYVSSVTVNDLGGNKVTMPGTAVITDVPLTATGVPVSATESSSFSGVVATFTDADPRNNPPSNYTASINWGDGTSTAGVVAFNSVTGVYSVSPAQSHAYGTGSYTISTTVTDQGGSTASTSSQATVVDAALTATAGPTISVSEGATYTGVVATFTDADTRANPVGTYAATISWGDGSTTLGTVTSATALQVTTYSVSGTHAYSAGNFSVSVTIHDIGGSVASAAQVVRVTDAAITAAPVAFTAQEGVPFSGIVARFTDADPRVNAASNYTASVDWGDGTTTSGTIAPAPNGGYSVLAGHTFSEEGSQFGIKVRISDVGVPALVIGSTDTATSIATIVDAPLLISGIALQATSQTAFTGAVGTFGDANRSAPFTDFKAAINWGDGTSSTGAVQPAGNGVFTVLGGHTYAEGGSYAVTLSVSDVGGSSVSSTAAVSVADKLFPLTAALDPASDSGVSATDGITNVITPAFDGTSEPGATVKLLAIRLPSSGPISLGSTRADATGHWSMESPPLIDGSYLLLGYATDAFGRPSSSLTQLLPSATQGALVIDTQGPRVAGVTLIPTTGQFVITFQDDLSGLNQAAVLAGANYSLSMPFVKGAPTFFATAISTVPQSDPTAAQVVAVHFNTPAKMKKGNYVLTISQAGITDAAGNTLVERFFIPLPTHGYRPQQNYQSQINDNGRTASSPQQYISPAELAAAAKQRQFTQQGRTVKIPRRR